MANTVIVIALLLTIILFLKYQPHIARQYLFNTMIGLVVCLIPFGIVYIGLPSIPTLCFVGWLVLSQYWTTVSSRSPLDLVTWIGMILVYELSRFASVEWVVYTISTLGFFMAVMVYIQRFVSWETVSKIKYSKYIFGINPNNYKTCGALFGNSNQYCATVLPSIFTMWWMAQNVSPFFYVLYFFIIVSIIISGSYNMIGALLLSYVILIIRDILTGKIEGLGVWVIILANLGVIGYLIFKKIKQGEKSWKKTKPSAFRERLGYYFTAIHGIKKRPLIGYGMFSFRREQFFITDRIKKKNPNAFKNMPVSETHKVHNDFLEMIFEVGIIGFVLFGLFLYQVPFWEGDRFLIGAIIAILLCALFFFPFHEPHVAIQFFALAGLLSPLSEPFNYIPIVPQAFGPATASIQPLFWVLLLGAIGLGVLSHKFGYKRFYALIRWVELHKFGQNKNGAPLNNQEAKYYFKLLQEVYDNDPYHNLYLNHLAITHLRSNPFFAFHCAVRMNEEFDGTMKPDVPNVLLKQLIEFKSEKRYAS